jgi:ferredoxin-NADP reductase
MIRDDLSDFKRVLLEKSQNDQMIMSGPLGHFTKTPETEAVYLAGGIGITPFMSMMRTHSDASATLIYSALGTHLFKDEIESFNHIDTQFVSGVVPTQKAIHDTIKAQPKATYYLVGSSGFLKGVESFIIDKGIDKSQIKRDTFSGY